MHFAVANAHKYFVDLEYSIICKLDANGSEPLTVGNRRGESDEGTSALRRESAVTPTVLNSCFWLP